MISENQINVFPISYNFIHNCLICLVDSTGVAGKPMCSEFWLEMENYAHKCYWPTDKGKALYLYGRLAASTCLGLRDWFI